MPRSRSTPPAAPLSGIVVADFSRVLAGPLCTMMLADAGARVIKVEAPGGGDETRRWGPPFLEGESAYFLSVNRSKESLTLDLKSEAGRSIAATLIERADVVVDNFRPSQRSRLGLGATRESNPRLIHCSIVGFESGSEDATLPGYDLLAQARSGLMAITGEPEGEPMKAGVALADVLTAHYAHGAINAALFARERHGGGASIEISLFGSMLASLVNVGQSVLVTGREAKRYGNAHQSIVPYQLFHASDRPFVLGVGTSRHFADLCTHVIGQPELGADRRFATNEARVRNREFLIAILESVFRQKPVRTWLRLCRARDIPAARVDGVKEALQSDAGRRLTGEIVHPAAGAYRATRSPIRREGELASIGSPPPRLGEHTDRLLGELGFSKREIGRLRREGVV
ncbi:MAG TPA: CoA transferase [Thermoanaerobaculia bacterium]|nr:CoA transferase [Thermoanaerobaculia bacterium]